MIDLEALVQLQDDSYKRVGSGLASSWPPKSAMDATELGSFLEQRHYCVLATSDRAGRPVARPVAFTVLGTSLWFATVRGVRLRNLQRTPWGSVVIEDGDRDSHRAVALDGPANIVDSPPPRLLGAWEQRHGSRAEWAAAWFELRPTRLLSYIAKPE